MRTATRVQNVKDCYMQSLGTNKPEKKQDRN